MDRIKAMSVFLMVARLEGFAPAARRLKMSTSAVSRYIIDLEEWLDAQLFYRTTRQLNLTEIGQNYLLTCRKIVDDVTNLEQQSSELHKNPRGEIKITTPVFLGNNFIGPLIPIFLRKYPHIKVNIFQVSRLVNLVEEGFDLALRIGEMTDSSLMMRTIGRCYLHLVASPKYLKNMGTPAVVEDVKEHNCIIDRTPGFYDRWPISPTTKGKPLKVEGNVIVSNGGMAKVMVLADIGISLLPDFIIQRELDEGKLISLFQDQVHYDGRISIVYPQTRHLSRSVRVFIDFLVDHMNDLKNLHLLERG